MISPSTSFFAKVSKQHHSKAVQRKLTGQESVLHTTLHTRGLPWEKKGNRKMKLSAVTETRKKGTEDDGIKGSTGCSIFPNKDDEKPLWGAYVRPTRRTNSKFLFCRFHSCGGRYGPCRIHGKLPFRLPNQMRAGRFLFPFRVVLFYEHLYYDFSGKKEICVPTFHLFFFLFWRSFRSSEANPTLPLYSPELQWIQRSNQSTPSTKLYPLCRPHP